jgi:hypothetical protein
VDDVQFDANWYTVPTKEELEQFYVEHFSSQVASNDDIPMDIPPAAPVAKSAPVAKPAPVVNDLATDPDDLPPPAPKAVPPAPKAAPKKEVVKEAAAPAPAEDINAKIDDILSGMSL